MSILAWLIVGVIVGLVVGQILLIFFMDEIFTWLDSVLGSVFDRWL